MSFELKKKIPNAHEDDIWSITWLNNETFATGSCDETVKIRNINGDIVHQLEGNNWGVVSVTAHQEQNIIASSSLDSKIRVWNSSTGKKITDINASPVETYHACINPSGNQIATSCITGGVNIWKINSDEPKITLEPHQSGIFSYCVTYSPNGRFIASGSQDGYVTIFDVETNTRLHLIEAHAAPIRTIKFSPDSLTLYTGSDDKHINMYDVQAGGNAKLIESFSGHSSWVLSLSCSFDFKYLASGSSDKKVKVWDISQRQCAHTFDDQEEMIWGVDFNQQGLLACCSSDKSVALYSCK